MEVIYPFARPLPRGLVASCVVFFLSEGHDANQRETADSSHLKLDPGMTYLRG